MQQTIQLDIAHLSCHVNWDSQPHSVLLNCRIWSWHRLNPEFFSAFSCRHSDGDAFYCLQHIILWPLCVYLKFRNHLDVSANPIITMVGCFGVKQNTKSLNTNWKRRSRKKNDEDLLYFDVSLLPFPSPFLILLSLTPCSLLWLSGSPFSTSTSVRSLSLVDLTWCDRPIPMDSDQILQ